MSDTTVDLSPFYTPRHLKPARHPGFDWNQVAVSAGRVVVDALVVLVVFAAVLLAGPPVVDYLLTTWRR